MTDTNSTQLIDQTLEDRFFKALLSHGRLIHLVKDRMRGQYFSTQTKAKLFTVIDQFVTEYGTLPTTDTLTIELNEKCDQHTAKLIQRLLVRLERLPVPEWGWIIGRINKWVKTIELRKALYEAAVLIDDNQLQVAQERVLKVIRAGGIEEAKSSNILQTGVDGITDYVMEKDLFCTPTRIYALDVVIKGLYRQELCVIMAPLNVGKTWAVIHLAIAALISGLSVLYVSLEMGRVKVIQRMFQNIAGAVAPDSLQELEREVELWTESFQSKTPAQARSLLDVSKVARHLGYLKNYGGTLAVESYPSGTVTTGEVEREILVFDAMFNKPPDVVIVDGLTDLGLGSGSSSGDGRRLGLADATRDLRRMAIQHNAAVVVTHQSNRPGLVAEIVEAVHTGEALAILQIADLGISLNQNRAEYILGKMRAFVMRARGKKKWVMIEMFQSLDIGQFCLTSRIMNQEEWAGNQDDSSQQQQGTQGTARGRAQRRFNT
jgi:replicative DNA helicase